MEDKTDLEIVFQYVFHMDNPCIALAVGKNIREVYVREATSFLKTIKDPDAREILIEKIKEYS